MDKDIDESVMYKVSMILRRAVSILIPSIFVLLLIQLFSYFFFKNIIILLNYLNDFGIDITGLVNLVLKLKTISKSPKLLLFIIALIIGISVCYVSCCKIRERNGEVMIFQNDRDCSQLKHKFIKSLSLKKMSQKKNYEEIADCFKHTQVSIYSIIKSLSKKETFYTVKIPQPQHANARKIMLTMLSKMDYELTVLARDQAKFGELQQDLIKGYFIFKAKSVTTIDSEFKQSNQHLKATTQSEYSFPLELFDDNSKNIDLQNEKANKKAKSLSLGIKAFLIASDIQASDVVFNVGNSLIEFKCNVAFKTKYNFDDLGNDMSNALGIKNILAKLSGDGKLLIMVPLNEEDRIPIDIKSMILEVFG